MTKYCLICGRELTTPGKFYDISIGPVCYQKNKADITAKFIQNNYKNSYSAAVNSAINQGLDLPLFKAIVEPAVQKLTKEKINKLKQLDFKKGFYFQAVNGEKAKALYSAGLYTLEAKGYFKDFHKQKVFRSSLAGIKSQLKELL